MPKPPATGQRVRPIRTAKDPSKVRISSAVRTAIHEMIHNARTRSQAAEIAGIKDDTLYRALCKPEVMGYKNEVLRAFRESLAEKSLVRTDLLADTAIKETVRLQANKVLLDQDLRFAPKAQVNHTHSGEIKFTPGYVIDLTDSDQLNSNELIEGEIVKQIQEDD